jgi:pimeloyl-ACP methyl ester carboxylesterase
MRRWMAVPLVFAVAVAVALNGDAPRARAADPVEETFPTADGVRLKGLFHKSPKAREGNPVVVLLYSPGPDRTMTKPGDWDGLANRLNDEGFHVFRFDWRGHGKSTDISDPQAFWKNPVTGPWNNRHIKGGNRRPVKNELNVKTDIGPRYFPAYVTDLAAVRTYLDQKNDEGALNSSSIYLIGAGDTAALGMLWLAAEWVRPSVHPVLGGTAQYEIVPSVPPVNNLEAARDVAGAIWLSGTRPPSMPEAAVARWVAGAPRLRENNPMLFLYGDKDRAAEQTAKLFFDEVLVAKGHKGQGVKPLEQTFVTPVAGAKTLSGVALLGQNAQLHTEDTIVKYLLARQKDRASLTRKERRFVTPYYINLGYFGLNP